MCMIIYTVLKETYGAPLAIISGYSDDQAKTGQDLKKSLSSGPASGKARDHSFARELVEKKSVDISSQ
jgi:hypothetical protein